MDKLEPSIETNSGYVVPALIFTTVIWGINVPVMKVGLTGMSPLMFMTLRFVIAAITTFAVLGIKRQFRRMPGKDILRIASISFWGLFFNQVLTLFGLPKTTAGNAALVLATVPICVVLINRVMNIEVITRRVALGVMTSLAGVFIIVLSVAKEFSLAGPHIFGALLILMGQFCYAYYTVFLKQLVSEYSIYQVSAIVMSVCSVYCCLVTLPEIVRIEWGSISAVAWYSIAFSGIFALSLGNFIWFWGVKKIGSAKTSLYNNVVPVVSIAFAWLFLDEALSFVQTLGAAVVFWGLYLTRSQPPQFVQLHKQTN
ncbi:MAG: carboxylate/amino acid/amine transporter [Firmicutes bacterium]|nr:carboxylate/amino acid/amine transporter [Bacillota bacterium]